MDGVLTVRGTITDRPPEVIAQQLWDLDAIAAKSKSLTSLTKRALRWLEPGDPSVLADTFLVSVAAVRFLRSEPQLPRAIVGIGWPPDALRGAFEELEHTHLSLMRSFLETKALAAD